jgi:thioredoxin reductase (NADPH)
MRAQAMHFGAEMVGDDIVEVDLTGDIKLLTDSSGTMPRTKTVIVVRGPRRLLLPRPRHRGRRRRQTPQWAPFLTRFAKSGTIVHRRSTQRASQVMQNRAFADDKISFAFDSEITELREENGMLAGLLISTGRFSR